jgi:hypothetical protein
VTIRSLTLALASCLFLLPACGSDTADTPEPGGQSVVPAPTGDDPGETSEDRTYDDY